MPAASEHFAMSDNWKAVYVPGYKDITPQTLRQVAVQAGVTIMCQDQVPVFANERLVAIHMAQGGKKTVHAAARLSAGARTLYRPSVSRFRAAFLVHVQDS